MTDLEWINIALIVFIVGQIILAGLIFRRAWQHRNDANIEYDSWGKP